MPFVKCMPSRFSGLEPLFFSSTNSNWSLSLVPEAAGAGLYMISVTANAGVETTKVATAGPDHELESGGLLAPVRLEWDAFQLRANTRALLVSVKTLLLRAEIALGEIAPPGSRGSVPSR